MMNKFGTGMMVLVDAVLTIGAIASLLQFKKKWWACLGKILCGCLMSGVVIYIGDWGNLPPTLAAFLLLLLLCCEGSSLKIVCIGLLISSTFFSWNAIVDNFIYMNTERSMLPRTAFALVFFGITKLFAPEKDYELDPGMWKLILFLAMIPMGNVMSVILLSDERWNLLTDLRVHFAVLCIALIAFIALLWAIRVLVRQKRLEQEAMLGQMNRKYYEAMEQQHVEIRRLKHDLSNHLQTLSLLPEEQKEEYIRSLMNNSSVTKTLNYCGDSTINAVLSIKEGIFKQQNISMQVKLDIPQDLPADNADICAIAANALDNAAEACMKLPVAQRKISIEGRAGKGMFVLKVKNPCEKSRDKKLSGRLNLPETTKKDKLRHGYGLRSIQDTIKKYGGNMEIRREDEEFELFCWFPFSRS